MMLPAELFDWCKRRKCSACPEKNHNCVKCQAYGHRAFGIMEVLLRLPNEELLMCAANSGNSRMQQRCAARMLRYRNASDPSGQTVNSAMLMGTPGGI